MGVSWGQVRPDESTNKLNHMKALEILNNIINEGFLPDCGTMTYDGSVSLRDWFGAVNHKGEMRYGTYFYLYAEHYDYVLSKMPSADVFVETEEAGNVWLWRIEE